MSKARPDALASAALRSIASDAGAARVADRLPEDRRPSRALLEALGLVEPEPEPAPEPDELDDEADDDEED